MSGQPSTTTPWRDRVDRSLGKAVLLVALAQYLIRGHLLVERISQRAPWWQVDIAITAFLVLLAVATLRAPMPLLRMVWATAALGGVLLRWVWAFTGQGLADDPWIYVVEPTLVLCAAAAWSLWAALAYVLVAVLVPPVLSGLDLAEVSPDIVDAVPRQLVIVCFIVGFHLVRQSFDAAGRASYAAMEAQVRAARSQAALAERERMVLVIHDQVLAALIAIHHDPAGRQSEVEAAAAIAAVRTELGDGADDRPAVDLGPALRSICPTIVPQVDLSVPPVPLLLPAAVADAILGAVREVLRNVQRHARPPGESDDLTVRVVLTLDHDRVHLRITDTGSGFRTDTVDDRRLGLRHGVHGRMATVPGGLATVASSPGEGTAVTLQWIR